MKGYPITRVDAFSTIAFGGNPAAVMPLEHWLDDRLLLAIAAENNLSETAYLVRDASGASDYELRWFTPAAEVPLCGHATLASAHVLLTADKGLDSVRFRTRHAGMLEVVRESGGYRMALPAYDPQPSDDPATVAALGGGPCQTLRHAKGYTVAVFDSADAVAALTPDFAALRAIGDHLTIATAPGAGFLVQADVVSRVFAPTVGIDEDPVTGSAHCVLTPYWAKRLGRSDFKAWQASARGGYVHCRLDGDRAMLGGFCKTTLVGEVFL